MDALIFMFAGAFLFLCGLVVGSRLAKGQEPVSLPRLNRPKPDPEPEEQGWASRDRPFVEDSAEDSPLFGMVLDGGRWRPLVKDGDDDGAV